MLIILNIHKGMIHIWKLLTKIQQNNEIGIIESVLKLIYYIFVLSLNLKQTNYKLPIYKQIIALVEDGFFEQNKQPNGTKRGFELFYDTSNIKHEGLDSINNKDIKKGEVYFRR